MKNPVRPIANPWDSNRGAQPFTRGELRALRAHASNPKPSLFPCDGRDDMLLFLLLRWTGFRRSDAVRLTWQEISFPQQEIDHKCKKNKKRVVLPIRKEFLAALEAAHQYRSPLPADPVLLDPETDDPFTGDRLYDRVVALGKRAGVHAYPHRFRDTFAVDMLLKSGSDYHVAKLLGDTTATVTKPYLPYARELRERARTFVDADNGIE